MERKKKRTEDQIIEDKKFRELKQKKRVEIQKGASK